MTVLESNLLVRRAAVAFDLGDTASALDTAVLGESLARLVDNERTWVEGALLRARIALWRGDLAAARALLASAETLSTGPDTEPVRDALERAALDVLGLGKPPREALADLDTVPIASCASYEGGARSPARDLVPVELRALAGVARADDLAAARDVERRAHEHPAPAWAWRAVAVRALLGDASAADLDVARRDLESRTGAADRVRVSYLAWRAAGRARDREAALAALREVRAGAPSPATELPFLTELQAPPA
jgi:hypothetical protein